MADERSDAEIFVDSAKAASQKEEAASQSRAARRKLLSLLTMRGGIVIALIAAMVIIGRFAYIRPEGSFLQQFAEKAAGGIATFLIIPWILLLLEHSKFLGTLGMVALSAACAVAALFADGVSRDFLMEASAGMILAVALDFLLHGFLKRIIAAGVESTAKLSQAREAFEAAKQKAASADTELDYKYAVNDYLGLPRGYMIGGPGANPFDPAES